MEQFLNSNLYSCIIFNLQKKKKQKPKVKQSILILQFYAMLFYININNSNVLNFKIYNLILKYFGQ